MTGTRALAITALLVGSTAAAQAPARPVIAVMPFTNSALADHENYQPFSQGMAAMLITEMRGNPGIQLVERERLQQVLEEVRMGQSGPVDPATAARAGKILGARHMIFGAFIIDRRGNLRLDARAVNVETAIVEHVETVSDDADNLLRAVQKLGAQLNQGLKLPGTLPATKPSEAARKGQVLADLKYARALQEEDQKNPARAVQFYREYLAESPADYAPAQRQEVEARLKVLTAGKS